MNIQNKPSAMQNQKKPPLNANLKGLAATDPANRARWALRVIITGLIVFFIWASYSEIDQVTRASAQIVAEDRTQVIQAADGGVLTQIHVREGDSVKAGQLLITLQKERASAAFADSKSKVAALKITLERLKSEVYGAPLKFDPDLLSFSAYIHNQTELYNKRQKALNDDIDALKKVHVLASEELRINRLLYETGDVSRAELLKLERTVADINAQITNRRNKYFQDTQAEMTKAQEDLSTQIEMLRDRSQVLEHTELLAPMDGVVNIIRINTLGAVAKPGETIMELLPTQSKLIVEAKVTPGDIAFVAVGQSAKIYLDAYDSSIYGALEGKVNYISPDVISEETKEGKLLYYRVRAIVLNPEFKPAAGGEIHVRPGLTGNIAIKARERTVLSYLLKPLIKTFNTSFGER